MSLVRFKITNHPQQVGARGANDTVDERITPDKVFDPLHEEFGFTLDAAANASNRKVGVFYSLDSDGLSEPWAMNRVWCNPPYSDIRPWVEKAWAEHRAGCPLIVMLLPANRCEQRWWQDLIEPHRDGRGPLETRFYRGRFNFGLPDNPEGKFHSSPPFGCVLVIWRRPCSFDPLRGAFAQRAMEALGDCGGPEVQGNPGRRFSDDIRAAGKDGSMRDSGSDPQGENAGTAVEGEASQSGAPESAHRPGTTPNSTGAGQ